MTQLDVTFANLYFAAAGAAAGPAGVPLAWRPLAQRRAMAGIEPIQFALAGMNAHINHDLPVAVVSTCAALGTAPDEGSHLADFQNRHLCAVADLVANWSINSARDLAWNNCLLLWALRDDPVARGLFLTSLAASTAIAGRLLLVVA